MCQYIRSLQGKFTEIWYAKNFGYLQICTHFEYSRDNNLEKNAKITAKNKTEMRVLMRR